MPNRIPLSIIEQKLPSFVKIFPESYRGTRYKADFIDMDYNEKFSAIVSSVIGLQHGCPTRSNDLRKKSAYRDKVALPLEDIKKQLPKHLEIDPATYYGKRYKARFYDKEYKTWFTAYVCNVIRTGKGFCPKRRWESFAETICIPYDELQSRVDKIYHGEYKLIEGSYANTGSKCKVLKKDGQQVIANVSLLLAGKFGYVRPLLERWTMRVKVRDNFLCQLCGKDNRPTAHHINSWNDFIEERFDVNNGVTFCQPCHDEFHTTCEKGRNTKQDLINWLQTKIGCGIFVENATKLLAWLNRQHIPSLLG